MATKLVKPKLQLDGGVLVPASAAAGRVLTSDASGNGTWQVASTGTGNLLTRSTSVATTAGDGEFIIATGSTAFTVTAPAAGANKTFGVINIASQPITVTVPTGVIYGVGMAGVASIVLPPGTAGGSVTLKCDGTNWYAVEQAYNKASYRAFSYRNGAHNGTNAGTGWVNLFQDTNVIDPSASVSASGYTCKVAGRYQVMAQAVYTSWTVTSGVAVYKNSAVYLHGSMNANGVFVSAVVPAAVNDVLAAYVYHQTSASALNAFTAGDNWMQVELLDAT